MTCEQAIERLKELADSDRVAGMARYGIATEKALGVSIPALRALAKECGKDHGLAAALWETGIHEAMILASMVDDCRLVTAEQMERWVSDFASWDTCDQVCANLFDKTPWAYEKAVAWAGREGEYVKRAGFVMMARMAVSDKRAGDEAFEALLPLIVRESVDERNMVKKAVNWALRQIGKRNPRLNERAIEMGRQIAAIASPAARWIAADALRELSDPRVQQRVAERPKPRP